MGISEEKSFTGRIDIQIFVHGEAQHDIREAFEHYEEINKGLGFEFTRSLDATLQFIVRNPHAYQEMYKGVRRALLRKFPYALFYKANENSILVVACLHQRRNEIDWLGRT